MRVLTPELWLHSAISGNGVGFTDLETRELDLGLARRSAAVINSIEGFIALGANATSGQIPQLGIVQEVDLDPDNVDVWLGDSINLDDVVYDSSRVFRHRAFGSWDTATIGTWVFNHGKDVSWMTANLVDRPITTRNMRHHVDWATSDVAFFYEAEVTIRYLIVELTLEELGYINASRR